MPIYEYQCGKCGHEFEREQRITEEPIKTCPACRSRKARRLISQTSFALKGSGWYSDLYSSKKSADGPKKEAKDGDGADKGAGKSSESKSADAGSKSGSESGSGSGSGSDKKSSGKASARSAA